MKLIELSKKLNLTHDVPDDAIKQTVLLRLQRAFAIDLLQEHPAGFHFTGTTGKSRGLVRSARVSGDINIVRKGAQAGILVNGYSRIAQSLMVAYTILFIMIMLVGLLPGFVETDERSTAADALVFLIFGIFIFYDIDKKLQEPADHIRAVLDSVDTELG